MEELSKRQKQILFLLLGAVLCGTGSLLYQHLNRGPVEILEVAPAGEPWPEAGARGALVVHVCGAVVCPGVYHLPAGSRVYEALEAAGGALPAARTDHLNLASLLKDGERIYLPDGQAAGAVLPAAPAPGRAQPAAPAAVSRRGSLVDPNRASRRELETIPGIGPVLAGRIIEYRETVGPFSRPEDLLKVSGIGPKTLEKIEKYLEFQGP